MDHAWTTSFLLDIIQAKLKVLKGLKLHLCKLGP